MKNKYKRYRRLGLIILVLMMSNVLFACAEKDVKIEETEIEKVETVDDNGVQTERKSDVEENTTKGNEEVETKKILENLANEKSDDENKLKKFIEANTIDSLLKKYLSVQYYDYEFNNECARTMYFEGYEDRQGNRAVRYKDPSFNQEYSFQNLPYYVQVDGGKYSEVVGEDSTPLPKDHKLNKDGYNGLDIISMNYLRKSIVSDKARIISDDTSGDVGVLTVELSFGDDKDMSSEYDVFYKDVLSISNINKLIIEYEYDKDTFAIKNEIDVAMCDDGSSYAISNITFEYDVNILTAIKVVNDEEGEVVYFDTKKLESANVYDKLKKDINSIIVTSVKYDKNNNVTHDFYIYKDIDGYIVVKDTKVKENGENVSSPIYHVKYEKKWYDYQDGNVRPTSMTNDEIKKYELDPIIQATNRRSLVDSQEKVVTSYEDGGKGIIVQEEKNLTDDKLYRASILPGIENVTKTRREVVYDMDEDIIKSYVLKSYVGSKEYVVERCEVTLDANEPDVLEKVMDYVDNIE